LRELVGMTSACCHQQENECKEAVRPSYHSAKGIASCLLGPVAESVLRKRGTRLFPTDLGLTGLSRPNRSSTKLQGLALWPASRKALPIADFPKVKYILTQREDFIVSSHESGITAKHRGRWRQKIQQILSFKSLIRKDFIAKLYLDSGDVP
jgi:hypothetical protein